MATTRPKFTPTEDGPYLLENASKLIRIADGKVYEIEGKVALCRCGGSRNKPFCDGTHKTKGFRSAKDPDRVPDRRESYAGKELTIHDNRGLCAHSARCTDNLKSVFRLGTEPWIDPDGATREEVTAAIALCPSGALSHSIKGKEQRDRGGDSRIVIVPHGPYAVVGGADLEGVEPMEGGTLDHFDLCRCGASKNKPFCSGAHWEVEFDQDAPPRK